jgi:uncharacterized membrane protein YhiD involved in acid resistance
MDTLLFNYGFTQLEWHTALLSFCVAFMMSSCVAYIYKATFQGLSYSRGLVQSMVLGSLISCLLMIAIGDNVARGIGIVGSLAIIRFRTNLRDPRDLVFLFASLGVGVAAGVQSYDTAIIGGLAFAGVAVMLYAFQFGSRKQHDGMVRFQIPSRKELADQAANVMKQIPKYFALVTMRDVAQGDMVDYTYQVKLVKPEDSAKIIDGLKQLEGIRGLTYMSQETTVEV